MLLLFVQNGITVAQTGRESSVLDSLIMEALQNNSGLQATYRKVKSDSAFISVSGALPDPVLSFNLLNLPVNTFRFDQEPMTGKQIAVRQKFPFFGTLGLKESIMTHHMRISLQDYIEYKIRLIKDVKALYYEINYIDSGIRITVDKETMMKSLVDVITTKYSVGRGLQQDVLKAQVELAKIIEERINFKRKREELAARLNALLNRPVNSPINKTSDPVFVPIVINRDEIFTRTLQERPLLLKLQIRISSKDEEINLAKKKYYPDLPAFAAYTQRDELQNGGSGVDFLSAGISLSIPLFATGIKGDG